jgi:hypothetical protein
MPVNPATEVQTEPVADGSPASRFPVADFARAVEARDYDAVLRLCTDDFVFHPLATEKGTFRGPARVRYLLSGLLETCDSFRYTGEVYRSHDTVALPLHSTFGGKFVVRAIDVLRIDENGKAYEMTAFGRTYMPETVLAGRVGLRMLRAAGVFWWLPFRIFLWPLEWSWRIAERIGMGWTERAMEKGLKRGRSPA